MRVLAAILTGLLLSLAGAYAQIELKLSAERTNFLLYESMPLTVSIKNISGQDLLFTTTQSQSEQWISFQVNSAEGLPVDMDLPFTAQPKTIKESTEEQVVIDIMPHYKMRSTGRYEVRAQVKVPGKGTFVTPPMVIWLGGGDTLWSQKRSVDGAERVYSLMRFAVRATTYLYVRVEEPHQNLVYSTLRLGELNYAVPLPSPIFDKDGALNILHPATATTFLYTKIGRDGNVTYWEEFRNVPSLPQLVSTPDHTVRVQGGSSITLAPPPKLRPKLSEGQSPNVSSTPSSSKKTN